MLGRSLAYVRQFNRNLWILSGGWFVGALGFAVSIPFISIYFHSNLGMSMSEIGIFFGAMAVVRSLFQLVAGEVSDRMERSGLLIYSQLCRAGGFALLALAIYRDWGFWPIAIFMGINSIFGAVFQPVANATVSDILPDEQRLDGYAITRSARNLGWAAGPAIGGFLAHYSYGLLFAISSGITLVSGLVFLFFLKVPANERISERFKFSDLIAIKDDPDLAAHSILVFALYLVVAQLMAPFSVYAVEIVKITEYQLGMLYTLNGIMVVLLQVPITRVFARFRLTIQLALGAVFYAAGYGMVGALTGFEYFVLVIIIVTVGEMIMSPPAMVLTSRMAPEGRMGRYMGIFSFFVASGWSFGPLYGGLVLDHFAGSPAMAWATISSLALLSAAGYLYFTRRLPKDINREE